MDVVADIRLVAAPAADDASQWDLEPCPNCGRRFFADKLRAHLRRCEPASSRGFRPTVTRADALPTVADRFDASALASAEVVEGIERVLCEQCGRKFHPQRLPVHLRVCARTTVASFRPTVTAAGALPSTAAHWSEMQRLVDDGGHNADAAVLSRVACSNCGRLLHPERLSAHLRVCTPPSRNGFRATVTTADGIATVCDRYPDLSGVGGPAADALRAGCTSLADFSSDSAPLP